MDNMFGNIRQRSYQLKVEKMKIKLLVDDITAPSEEISKDILHSHPYAELFAALSGAIEVNTESETYRLEKGDALLIPAGILHRRAEHERDGDWRSIGFSLEKQADGSDLYRHLSRLTEAEKPIRIPASAQLCVDRAMEAMVTRPIRLNTLPVIRLLLLLAEFVDAEQPRNCEPAVDDRNDLTLDSRLDYIVYECFMQNITAAEAARQLYISERQLSRICRHRYGMGFGSMIRTQRMTAATNMLRTGCLSQEEIAFRCGYMNKHSFLRAFKAKFGIAPAEWKQRNKQG